MSPVSVNGIRGPACARSDKYPEQCWYGTNLPGGSVNATLDDAGAETSLLVYRSANNNFLELTIKCPAGRLDAKLKPAGIASLIDSLSAALHDIAALDAPRESPAVEAERARLVEAIESGFGALL